MDVASQLAWVTGFLSAFNFYGNRREADVAGSTDVNGIFAWLDNYCAANPLHTVAEASVALVTELSKDATR